MRNIFRIVVALGAASSLTFAACGDSADTGTSDTTGGGTDTTGGGNDTTGGGNDTTGGGGDTVADTGSADPCDPNPCQSKAAECNAAGDSSTTYTGPGTCTASNGAASCDFGAGTTTACGSDQICTNGACITNPTTFSAGPSSFLSSLSLVTDTSCCFDFGGKDAENDNAFGTIIGTLLGFLGNGLDIDQTIADSIADGSITILLETPTLSGAGDQADLAVNGYLGEPTTDHATNLTGMGMFEVDPASFIPNTLVSQITTTGSISGGTFAAGPTTFALAVPLGEALGDISLNLAIEKTQIESTVTVGANGTGLAHADGKLGGVISLDGLVEALNVLGTACPCLGMPAGADLLEKTDEDTFGCSAAGELVGADPGGTNMCTEADDGALCDGVGSNAALVCSLIGQLLKPDIDTDNNNVEDSFSIALEFEGVSAEITGIATTQ